MHKRALSIITTLKEAGHEAYYAGGWVRDFILRHESDDIDIATSALPEDIQKIFPHTVPIGIAFGIILVVIDEHKFEVATFRQDIEYKDGRRPTKIAYTSAKEDCLRRDFTINGMFYDPIENKIIDYVNGAKDLQDKIIRAIGDPHERIHEDRLRMIRAVRMACRFNFVIEKETQKAILAHSKELFPSVAIERVWQEMNKMSSYGKFKESMVMMQKMGLLETIFPSTKDLSAKEVEKRLINADHFPSKTPAVAKLMELFPSLSKEEKEKLCKDFKLSRKEILFAIYLHEAHLLLLSDKITDVVSLSYFYADDRSEIVLGVLSCKIPLNEKPLFLKKHREKQQELSKIIARIKANEPLVKAEDLRQCGIQPGIKMGRLLNEAEAISITRNIDDKEEVLGILKKSPIWKHSDK